MKHLLFALTISVFLIGCKKEENNNEDSSAIGDSRNCTLKDKHNPNLIYDTIKDIDGNTYKTIQIGNQTWMAENLRTTKYRNGVSLPNIKNNTDWKNIDSGAYCFYDNNINNDCPYGKLYNWYAVNNSNKICPEGWHIPSTGEWQNLIIFLGSNDVASGKLKSTGGQYWLSPNEGATNSSGFSALPGGSRSGSRIGGGEFKELRNYGSWYSSTRTNAVGVSGETGGSQCYGMSYYSDDVYKFGSTVTDGLSVRCVKD
jgi:uncharacterized protein (TIGR02145 family)